MQYPRVSRSASAAVVPTRGPAADSGVSGDLNCFGVLVGFRERAATTCIPTISGSDKGADSRRVAVGRGQGGLTGLRFTGVELAAIFRSGDHLPGAAAKAKPVRFAEQSAFVNATRSAPTPLRGETNLWYWHLCWICNKRFGGIFPKPRSLTTQHSAPAHRESAGNIVGVSQSP